VYRNVVRIDYPAKGDAPMKVLQVYSAEETQTVWTGTIKRLLHRYLEHRNKRRALAELKFLKDRATDQS
jgi:hypothetical protein